MAHEAALFRTATIGRARTRLPGKHIVLILFAPVVLVAIGSGLWLHHVKERSIAAAIEYRQLQNGARAAYFPLPEFLVDLQPDASGRTSYLKINASISLPADDAKKTAAILEGAEPAIVERLTFFLRELRPEDFKGSEGMARVKREMARRVSLVVDPAIVSDIVVENLVIQ